MNASPCLAQVSQPELDWIDAEARAASSMFDSTAQICCGLPKPRNAVEGTVCERTLRARIRTFGTRYGPFEV